MFETLKVYLQTHRSEMVILGVMAAVTLTVSIAMAGGNIGEAIARGRR
jgi:hypothetical protein